MKPNPRVIAARFLSSSSFDIEEFRTIKDPYDIRAYLYDHRCPLLGQGAEREVYDIGGGRVLKLMRESVLDTRANAIEVKTSECLHGSKVIANVLDHDTKALWLVMEKAIPFKSEGTFLKALNLVLELPPKLRLKSSDDFITLMDNYKTRGIKKSDRVLWVESNPTQWWLEIYKAVNGGSCNLDVFDYKAVNWGMIGDRLVILDYGGN